MMLGQATSATCSRARAACSPATQDSSGAIVSEPTVGVRERATGTISVSAESSVESTTLSAGANVTLEGFSRTGRALWSFDAGHATQLATHANLPEVGPNESVVPARGGLVALDLLDGSQRRATANLPAWCRAPTSYSENVPYAARSGPPLSHYIGQLSLYPCRRRRAPTGDAAARPGFRGRPRRRSRRRHRLER